MYARWALDEGDDISLIVVVVRQKLLVLLPLRHAVPPAARSLTSIYLKQCFSN